MTSSSEVDALVVGAGPTGLALATQLQTFGARFRIIDRLRDRTRESRALGVQARTLELLQTLGLGERLVGRGNSSTRLKLHLEGRPVAAVRLGDIGAVDTRFPFILFVSQVETEDVLNEWLRASGVVIERGTELVSFEREDDRLHCLLQRDDGPQERVHARFLVGCDGAHSAVRKQSGIAFEGGTYPQDFALGDVELDGPLEPKAINSFAGGGGVAMFFPLGRPTTWRVIAMAAGLQADAQPRSSSGITSELELADLQALVDPPTAGAVRLRDPAWLTRFHLHHRQTATYRAGNVFLAGDAAHIHSPVGAQGMNTGIQDAWNLGWKIGLVARGLARDRLLDTYEAERWPIGQFPLRYTDRLFSTFTRAMSGHPLAAWPDAWWCHTSSRVFLVHAGFAKPLSHSCRSWAFAIAGVQPLPRESPGSGRGLAQSEHAVLVCRPFGDWLPNVPEFDDAVILESKDVNGGSAAILRLLAHS